MALTDEEIREMAERRVGFRRHAAVYVIVNVFLFLMWFLRRPTDPVTPGFAGDLTAGNYWPLWAHLGWGIGLVFHGWSAYGSRPDAVAREEATLREKYRQ